MSVASFVFTVMGCVSIAIGIAMAIFEMLTIKTSSHRMRGVSASPKSIIGRVSYPSLVIIGIGAIMVLVGTSMSN